MYLIECRCLSRDNLTIPPFHYWVISNKLKSWFHTKQGFTSTHKSLRKTLVLDKGNEIQHCLSS